MSPLTIVVGYISLVYRILKLLKLRIQMTGIFLIMQDVTFFLTMSVALKQIRFKFRFII